MRDNSRPAPQKRISPKKEKPKAPQPKQAESSIATRDRASTQAARAAFNARKNSEARFLSTSTRVGDLTGLADAFNLTSEAFRKIMLWAGCIISISLALVVGLGILYRSDVFKIEFLSVQGVRHLTSTEVADLAAVPDNTTLLRVDTDGIRERLLQDAWIAEVTINRILPNTLELDITERNVFAVVEILNSDASSTIPWAISADGLWLMPIPDQDSEQAKTISQAVYDDLETSLRITDVSYSVQPEIGTFCTGTTVKSALEVLNGMTTSLVDRVVSVDAGSNVSLVLLLDDGVEIDFGDASDIRTKERIVLELLDKYQDSVAYINVSSVNNPTCRRV